MEPLYQSIDRGPGTRESETATTFGLTPVHPRTNARKSLTGPIAYLIEVAGIVSAIIEISSALKMAGVSMVTTSTLAIYTG